MKTRNSFIDLEALSKRVLSQRIIRPNRCGYCKLAWNEERPNHSDSCIYHKINNNS